MTNNEQSEYLKLRQHAIKQVSEIMNISEKNAETVINGGLIILAVIDAIDPKLYNQIKEFLIHHNDK